MSDQYDRFSKQEWQCVSGSFGMLALAALCVVAGVLITIYAVVKA